MYKCSAEINHYNAVGNGKYVQKQAQKKRREKGGEGKGGEKGEGKGVVGRVGKE